MAIWVDADGCPRAVKEILYRAAERTYAELVLVANRVVRVPPSPLIRTVTVGRGLDEADDYIAAHVEAGDLVITSDIPLAAQVTERGAMCIEHRGDVVDSTTARQRLAVRELLEDLRAAGELQGGPPPFGERDKRRFAGSLDRLLEKGWG